MMSGKRAVGAADVSPALQRGVNEPPITPESRRDGARIFHLQEPCSFEFAFN